METNHQTENDTQQQLIRLFQNIQNEIPIYLFAQPGINDAYTDAIRQTIRLLREISDKFTLKEFNLNHEFAKKWDVKDSPTLIFHPDKFHIRWLGAPIGEEGKIIVQLLLMVGLNQSQLGKDASHIIKKIDTTKKIKVFVSPTCPYCPQQAINAIKAAIENPEFVSMEMIDIQANPQIAEEYNAHSVPMTYANDVLIAQGAQSEELFASSLDKMEQQTIFIPESDAKVIETDLVIVGGGPAGLSAGIYASRSGLKTVVVEKDVLGGQVATTPIVENYPGLTQVGGKTLVDIMVTHALEYVNIFPQEAVFNVEVGEKFVVQTSKRKFNTKTLLLATGATHRTLEIPGEKRLGGHGVSYCSTCDGPLFKNQKVIMVGGGNSAATEALHLANIGVNVTLIHRRDTLRAQQTLIDKLIESQIPILFNTEVQEIKGHNKVSSILLFNNKTQEVNELNVDGVFVAIGYLPSNEIAKKLSLKITDDGFIAHDNHRTGIPGIYVAGDVAGGFKQIVTAAGQGATAALTIFEDLINPYWKK